MGSNLIKTSEVGEDRRIICITCSKFNTSLFPFALQRICIQNHYNLLHEKYVQSKINFE